MEAELRKKLMAWAGRLLLRRAYSRGEMAAKLSKLADESEVEEILHHLEELNLLNDAEYAYNLATYRLKQQGWGPLKVRHDLLRRHVAPHIVESALDRNCKEAGEQPFLRDYLERYSRKSEMPSDRKGIRQLILHLRRRGFTNEIIYSTLRQIIGRDAWQRFEHGE